MLSKNKLKYIRSLAIKKFRDEEKAFVAEGPKLVEELIKYYECSLLIGVPEYLKKIFPLKNTEVIEVNQEELARASNLKTPQSVLAVFKMPMQPKINIPNICQQLCLGLDAIQDPGNLGTIIRIADWFGIEHIFCSLDTVDAFSPKTVQATMGAIGRVNIHYVALDEFLNQLPKDFPIYGTFLDGQNIYSYRLPSQAMIVMGNEGKGISSRIEAVISDRLFIPNFPIERETSESLNVAVATAITCAEFRRQTLL